jgi:putative toxin-antitoxin system antitoxin component (TIGR02293 family)
MKLIMAKVKKYMPPAQEDVPALHDFQGEYGYSDTFVVRRGDDRVSYEVKRGYGYFLVSLRDVHSMFDVAAHLEKNLTFAEISPIVDFLELKMVDVAKAAAVSPSTVSRWSAASLIGTPGSYQFFKIDEAIRKGMEVFGQQSHFKSWLHTPNLSLGQSKPVDLMLSMAGIELVHEAVDALHYGNFL